MESLLFHPKVVHLPLALGILMPFIAAGLAIAWWRKWLPARTWVVAVLLQALLLTSAIVALRSGEADEDRAEQVVAERVINQHEEAAETFTWASGGVLALMLATLLLAKRRIGLALAAVAIAGSTLVLGLAYRTGEAGGALVYEHGAASAHTQPTGATAPGRSARPPHDDD